MKSIVVFYSVSGQTEYVGRLMAKELGCECLKIEGEKEIRPDVVSRYVQGSKAMISGNATILKNYDFNAEDYDNVIIGFPNWASNCPPVMKRFLEENDLAGDKVFLYTTYVARGGKKCVQNTARRVNNGIILGDQKFSLPKSKNQEKFKVEIDELLKEWGLKN